MLILLVVGDVLDAGIHALVGDVGALDGYDTGDPELDAVGPDSM